MTSLGSIYMTDISNKESLKNIVKNMQEFWILLGINSPRTLISLSVLKHSGIKSAVSN